MKRSGLMMAMATTVLPVWADAWRCPNVLLFMVDDMGWQDTSVPFTDSLTDNNRKYLTPNMERLAARGVRFSEAYASAISSPSRCSLMTGANAARHGVTNWTLFRDESTDGVCDSVLLPDWNCNGISRVDGIGRTYVGHSFVQCLKNAGYHTMHVGKAHFGAFDTPGEDPHHWGFEVNVAGSAAGGLATYLSERNYGHDSIGNKLAANAIADLEKYWGTGTFATEALTQEALKCLDKAKLYNQPWFLYMSHYAVHVPYDRDMRFYNKYIGRGLSEKESAYASLIEGMDKSLGDLLDWIDRNGESDNTIVIFMSDNGGLSADGYWRDEPLHTHNAPLRSGKGSLYEGGVRVPLIVSMPGVSDDGSAIDGYVSIEDVGLTILDMAGVSGTAMQSDDAVDGRSFLPRLHGADSDSDRMLVWNYPNIWGLPGPGIDLNCAARKGRWKFIYNYVTGDKELYDLSADISEEHNVADEYSSVVDVMAAELGKYLREVGAGRPLLKSTGQPCAWPDGQIWDCEEYVKGVKKQ